MSGERAGGGHVIGELSAYLDGDLGARAAEEVRAHLDGCAGCARAADELRAIVAGARDLARPEPPPTLWPAIEGALAREEDSRRVFWRPFFVRGFAAGGLAGAALAVVIGIGAGVSRRAPAPAVSAAARAADGASSPGSSSGSSGAPSAEPVAFDPLLEEAEVELQAAAAAYERSIEKLRGLLAREEPRWSPDARARCAERLARLDEAIARSRADARRTPGDRAGSEILFAAYRSKIDFLADVVQRGRPASGEAGPW